MIYINGSGADYRNRNDRGLSAYEYAIAACICKHCATLLNGISSVISYLSGCIITLAKFSRIPSKMDYSSSVLIRVSYIVKFSTH